MNQVIIINGPSCASIDGDICSSVAKYELIDKNQVLQTELEEYKIKTQEARSEQIH